MIITHGITKPRLNHVISFIKCMHESFAPVVANLKIIEYPQILNFVHLYHSCRIKGSYVNFKITMVSI